MIKQETKRTLLLIFNIIIVITSVYLLVESKGTFKLLRPPYSILDYSFIIMGLIGAIISIIKQIRK